MHQLQPSDFMHPDFMAPSVAAALRQLHETGELDWTAPEGTPPPPAPPNCAACQDVGIVAIREPGQVVEYVPCASCTLYADRRLARLLNGVPRDYRRTFEDFFAFVSTGLAQSFGIRMLEWAEAGEGSILLVGPEGTLKTTLGTAAYLRRVELHRPETAEWFKTPDLLDEIRRSFDRELNIPLDSLPKQRARTCQLLMLDDLGAQQVIDRNAPWVQEQLYSVVDHRSSDQLPTIFTSNLSIEQLKNQLGKAIVSRIVGMCEGRIVVLDGADVRYGIR